MPANLQIGIDSDKAVVTPHKITLRTGRARRHRAGSLTEVVPVAPSGRSRDARLTSAARLALPLLFVSAGLFGAGLPWWLPAAASAALVALLWRHQSRAAQHASFAIPREGHVLWSSPERAALVRAVRAARRVRRTWPGLAGMIEPATADHALTAALDDLAGVLARRQEIRQVRAALSAVRHESVPADSPALAALDEQYAAAEHLWQETGEQADRIMRAIEATASAGETFLHEHRISETARRAELVLSGLTAALPSGGAGTELADRTETVIAAYRDLAGTDHARQ